MKALTTFRRVMLAAAVLVATVAQAEAQAEVTIGLASGSLVSGTGKVAEALGLFEKHGIAPRFIVMDSSSAAVTALISGSVDAAVTSPGDLVVARARGQDIVAIAMPYAGLGASVVLSKEVAESLPATPDSPAEERLAALDGLLLAVQSATTVSKVSMDLALESVGATARYTYMGQQAMPSALETGAVQGYVTGAPTWTRPVVDGHAVLWLSGPRGEFPPEATPSSSVLLMVLRSRAEADPDLMQRMAAVFRDLGEAVKTRRDEVRAAIGQLYPTFDDATLDLLMDAETSAWRSDEITEEAMANEIRYMERTGAQVPGLDDLDPRTMFYP